jgi:hypothetical protein
MDGLRFSYSVWSSRRFGSSISTLRNVTLQLSNQFLREVQTGVEMCDYLEKHLVEFMMERLGVVELLGGGPGCIPTALGNGLRSCHAHCSCRSPGSRI